jgi:transcriptional regulator
MYLPPVFAETDLAKLHAFIEQNSFGLLVSQVDGQPFASHLPLLLNRRAGPYGCLIGHLARANPQWREAAGQQVLAVFSGPHAYISPRWYEAELVVPTWNYVAVHAYGSFAIVDDRDALTDILHQFVRVYEQSMPQPWALTGPEEFVRRMVAQVVGFHIPIERLEGKWKLNQNQPAERRTKVIRVLRERGDETSQAVAALMEGMLSSAEKGE